MLVSNNRRNLKKKCWLIIEYFLKMKISKKYNYILNPKTNRKVILKGKTGQQLLKKYLYNFKKHGGASALVNGKTETPPSNKAVPASCSNACTPSDANPTSETMKEIPNDTIGATSKLANLKSVNNTLNIQNKCLKTPPPN